VDTGTKGTKNYPGDLHILLFLVDPNVTHGVIFCLVVGNGTPQATVALNDPPANAAALRLRDCPIRRASWRLSGNGQTLALRMVAQTGNVL
jgi:hypothetical protein